MTRWTAVGRRTRGIGPALFGILAYLLACAPALADFSSDMQTGLDNTQFTFYSYTYESANDFYLVTGVGADGDAVRSGAIGSTSSSSAESGVYFNVTGPGTISFRWKMSGQTVVNGKGAIFQYIMFDPNDSGIPHVTAYITGVQDWATVNIPVPAASRQIIITYIRSFGSAAVGSDAGWVDQLTWTPTGGPDTTPNPFSFVAQTNVAPATVATSNSITVSGINAAAPISIASCTGTACAYSINGGAWTSSAGTVQNGNTVQVRQTTSASFGTATTLTLNIGGVTGTFSATTAAADTTPNAFTFASQSDAALSSVATSNSITVSGITAAAPISIASCTGTACAYSINGGAWTSSAGTVQNGNTVQVRQTTSGSNGTTTALTLNIGGVTGTFNATTIAADTTPNAFTFTGQTGAALSSVATSNSITVGGINASAPISIASCSGTACAYSINGGAWTSSAGTVQNGNTVQVRQTTSGSYGTTTALTLNIGGVTGTFNATTLSAPVLQGQTPTGTGVATAFAEFAGNSAPACAVASAAFVNAPVAPPAGVTLPHGMFAFTASGCTTGFSVVVTIEYPSAIPAGATYWKYDAVKGWFTIPATIAGNRVSFTVVDNGQGDANAAAGTITDPGGIGYAADSGSATAAIPTLSEWGLIGLAALLSLMAWISLRRRPA